MDRKQEQWKPLAGGAEPGFAGSAEPGSGLRGRGSPARRYGRAEKLALIERYESSGMRMREFCAERRLSTKSLCDWRRAFARGGEAALSERPNPRNRRGARGRQHTSEERRAAVEAFEKSGLSRADFAATFGVTTATLSTWLARYRAGGPKSLEPSPRRKRSGGKHALAPTVREAIVHTKRRFPTFGLKKIRDFLARFAGVAVSTGSVRKTLREHGVERPDLPAKKRRAKSALPRRFERARPMQLWQSDITSFVLSRSGRRVYLVVFLDDCSRYVVSFALATSQRADLVVDALQEGIVRYGKPAEVLTDQGRQYYAWRGRSAFQKLLSREGIRHVVSRAHHPETLGKCERLWETVNREFWERVRPDELADARERLSHFFAHYNHFRPHQGIEGLVPADRFFGAEDPLRKTLEKALSQNELAKALEEPLRRPVYLFGQLGDQQVSLHGERGKLVIHTSDGVHQEMHMDELGMSTERKDQKTEQSNAERVTERNGRGGQERYEHAASGEGRAPAHGQEARALQESAAPGSCRAGALGEREQRGEDSRTQDVHDDAGALAWQDRPDAGVGGTGDCAAAGLAAQSAGPFGYAGGPLEAATQGTLFKAGASDDGPRGRPQDAQEGNRDLETAAEARRGFDCDLPGAALCEGGERETAERGGGQNAPQGFGGKKRASEESCEEKIEPVQPSSADKQGDGSRSGNGSGTVIAPGSQEPWV